MFGKKLTQFLYNDVTKSKFEEIVGHNDIKGILTSAIASSKPVHVLLIGPSGSAKTMFLIQMLNFLKGSCFIVASNATKAGLVNQLFEKRSKFILVDELEKMKSMDQVSLLHLMETGIISETKINKTRQMQLTSWIFATANSRVKIIEPLLSRFVVLEIPKYTLEEFIKIAVSRLEKEKINESKAITIAEHVWIELGSSDIRDVVKVARLSRNSDVSTIIATIKKYSRNTGVHNGIDT